MIASVIIPTFNRDKYLRKVLSSLMNQTLSLTEFEIIVVDNCSTDTTKKVVLEEFGNAVNVSYIYDEVPGLNHARNTGWKNSRGRYVAFLDDDAVACSHWLEKMVVAFETIIPTPGCVGGPLEAIWETSRPNWLGEDLLSLLTILDWSNEPKFLENPQFLAGANFAFPRVLLESIDGFKVGIDRVGENLLSNGDIMIVRMLENAGHCPYYDPGMKVQHHVSSVRSTQRWFLRRVFWQGVSDAVMEMQVDSLNTTERISKGLRPLYGVILSPKRLLNLILPTNQPEKFSFKCSTVGRLGYVVGFLRFQR